MKKLLLIVFLFVGVGSVAWAMVSERSSERRLWPRLKPIAHGLKILTRIKVPSDEILSAMSDESLIEKLIDIAVVADWLAPKNQFNKWLDSLVADLKKWGVDLNILRVTVVDDVNSLHFYQQSLVHLAIAFDKVDLLSDLLDAGVGVTKGDREFLDVKIGDLEKIIGMEDGDRFRGRLQFFRRMREMIERAEADVEVEGGEEECEGEIVSRRPEEE